MMPAEQFLQFPSEVRSAVDLKRVFAPAFQKTLQTVHDHGYRIYTYMDPLPARGASAHAGTGDVEGGHRRDDDLVICESHELAIHDSRPV